MGTLNSLSPLPLSSLPSRQLCFFRWRFQSFLYVARSFIENLLMLDGYFQLLVDLISGNDATLDECSPISDNMITVHLTGSLIPSIEYLILENKLLPSPGLRWSLLKKKFDSIIIFYEGLWKSLHKQSIFKIIFWFEFSFYDTEIREKRRISLFHIIRAHDDLFTSLARWWLRQRATVWLLRYQLHVVEKKM